MLHGAVAHTELSQCLDLAKAAQITTDYRKLVEDSAGPLIDLVRRVFPGHLQFVYLVTDDNRRQIWNAHMAAPSVSNRLAELSAAEMAQYRYRLLTESSHSLILEAYASTCEGLLSLYGKLGRIALSPEFYADFHRLVVGNADLRRILCHSPAIDPSRVSLLFEMPEPLQSYHLAKELRTEANMKLFRDLFLYITARDFRNKEALVDRLVRGIRLGKAYEGPLRKIMQALPFPRQLVPNEGPLRFIANGAELVAVSRRYKNCLAGYVSLALTGERQYYEWKGSSAAVIGLRRYRVDTWYIEEIRLKKNAEPPVVLQQEIHSHFAAYGINDRRWCQIDAFDHFLSRVEEMNLDEVLQDLEAA